MARVVFMGTPEYAVPSLETLIETQEVVAVVTQPDRYGGRGRKRLIKPPVKEVAEAHEIPVLQPRRLSRDDKVLDTLRSLQADAFVLAAYGQILRANVLDMPPYGVIGVHASLLPRWRGAAPVAAAIRAGDDETGVTLMLTGEGLDTGAIIAQRRLPIADDDTRASLTAKLADLGAELLRDTLPDWLAGRIEARPQNEQEAIYAHQIDKSEGAIDWTRSARAIDRQIRALSPWPGTFCDYQGTRLKILEAHPIEDRPVEGEPGQVIEVDNRVAVVTGEGLLALDRVQLAGKRAMDIDVFARGHTDLFESVLE